MRILRSTFYPPPGITHLIPVTNVVRASDIICSLEAMQEDLLHTMKDQLMVFDVFELPDDVDIVEATLKAGQRMATREETEKHLVMLYYWAAFHLRMTNPGGTLMMDRPAPLNADDMKKVFSQLARSDFYQQQTIIAFDQNNVRVEHNAKTRDPLPENVS